MITDFLHILQSFVEHYGAWGVFWAVVIEEVIAPIPSGIIIMGASFLLVPNDLAFGEALLYIFFNIALPAAFGMVAGSTFIYGIGYFGGKPVVRRWGKWLGISWENIEKVESRLSQKHADIWMLFVFRTLPIIPSVVLSAFCGIVRLKWWLYAAVTFVGSILRATAIALIGWQAQGAYEAFAEKMNLLEDVILGAVILAAVIAGIVLYRRRNRVLANQTNP